MAKFCTWWGPSLLMTLVLALVVSACGGDTAETSTTTSPTGGTEREESIIRFAFSPDPVMDYLTDTGKVELFEAEWGVRLIQTQSWDEFAFFAGGHGEIASMATYDMPILTEETGIAPVGFGRYNHTRMIIGTRCDSGYETMADIAGMKFGVVEPTTSGTMVGTIVHFLHPELTYSLEPSESDFEIIYSDHAVLPELVAEGELAAAYMIPELAAPLLRDGTLCAMYGGRAVFQIFRDLLGLEGHDGVESNVFVADNEWFDSHPYEVQFFLALWEEGVKLWARDQQDIIATYPQHFAVETPEDIEYITNWVAEHQFFADTVYLDQVWIDAEYEVFDLIKDAGFMEAETPNPELVAVERAIPEGIDMAGLTDFEG